MKRGDSPVAALVARAAAGDQQAWDDLVERYKSLVLTICVRHRLDRQDSYDVSQTVWMLLVENLGCLRDPEALPGWLGTTTRHECLRVLRAGRRRVLVGLPPEEHIPADETVDLGQEIMLAERDAALRAAFSELPRGCRDLLSMLISDPPSAYRDISKQLGMAVGSIGAQRARCLDRLRRSPHLADFADD